MAPLAAAVEPGVTARFKAVNAIVLIALAALLVGGGFVPLLGALYPNQHGAHGAHGTAVHPRSDWALRVGRMASRRGCGRPDCNYDPARPSRSQS